VGWGHLQRPPLLGRAGRGAPRPCSPAAPHGEDVASGVCQSPETAAHGGGTGRDAITGQLCSRESRTGWENPAPQAPSCGKAPRPWGAGAGDSAPAAPGPAPRPRGFSFPEGKPAPVFLPGVQAGRIPPSPIFEPPRASRRSLGAAAGMQRQSPHPRVPSTPRAPRHSPAGPLPARPAPTGTDNGVGRDQRSRAQRSRHYTLTSRPVEQRRSLVAKTSAPQSKLGANWQRGQAVGAWPGAS